MHFASSDTEGTDAVGNTQEASTVLRRIQRLPATETHVRGFATTPTALPRVPLASAAFSCGRLVVRYGL